MAEQPEIETLRRDLDREIGGKRIKTVEVPGSGAIPRHSSKKQFVGLLEGTKVGSVVRRDLLLVAKRDSGDALVIDMSGGGHPPPLALPSWSNHTRKRAAPSRAAVTRIAPSTLAQVGSLSMSFSRQGQRRP